MRRSCIPHRLLIFVIVAVLKDCLEDVKGLLNRDDRLLRSGPTGDNALQTNADMSTGPRMIKDTA
jgi:hypothetical protein